jgi:hypothetical protein
MGNPNKVLTVCTILQVFVFVVLVPFLPLLISWNWHWWEAWVYALVGVLVFVLSRFLAASVLSQGFMSACCMNLARSARISG